MSKAKKTGRTKAARRPRSETATRRQPPPQKKSNAGKIVLATMAVGAAGVVGYFGYQEYKKYRSAKQRANSDSGRRDKIMPESSQLDNELKKLLPGGITNTQDSTRKEEQSSYTPPNDTTTTYHSGKHSTASAAGDDFPLHKGSKGEKVKQLQQALIEKYGHTILPKYGADGDFGSETVAALKKKGYTATVSESTFNVIVDGGAGTGTDLSDTAHQLYEAASAENLTTVISLLKKLGNKDDYQQVSTAFKEYRLHGVRQTLVTGLLNAFSQESQQRQIRQEFLRMGLSYKGGKWSLSGFDGKPIVTTEATIVWVSPVKSIQVPAMMVLGNEVTQRLDYTMFENNDKYFLVKTQSIKYL